MVYTMPIVSVAFFIGGVSKPFYGLFLFYLLTVESANFFLWKFFMMPLNGGWLSILLASSQAECQRFLSAYRLELFGMILGAVVILVLIGFAIWKVKMPQPGWRNSLIGLLLCVPYFALNAVPERHQKVGEREKPDIGWFHKAFGHKPGWISGLTALELPLSTYRHDQTYHQSLIKGCRNPDIPEQLDTDLSIFSKPPLFVFALGESSTRNHWSLYGYPRMTTPCLDAWRPELLVFDDVDGVCCSTSEAMHFLLTAATVENPSHIVCTLPTACKRAGYRCVLISVQSSWQGAGRKDEWDPLRLVLTGCDRMIFTTDGVDREMKGVYDDSVLPHLDNVIAESADCPTVVFLHFIGAHFPPAEFYPPSASIFEGSSKSVDEYDNATRFHDGVLGQVLARVKGSNRPSFVFYISDHGETPDSNNWRCMSDRSLWELPMFIWFSSEYKEKFESMVSHIKRYAQYKMQPDELFDSLLSLCRIQGVPITTGSMENGSLKPRKNRKTNEGRAL